jgi:hypothetical protein
MTCQSGCLVVVPWRAVTDLRADGRHPLCHPASERIICAQELTHAYAPIGIPIRHGAFAGRLPRHASRLSPAQRDRTGGFRVGFR